MIPLRVWMLGVALAGGFGFRGDGDGSWPETHPPRWTADGPWRWRTPLEAWSNTSPVRFRDMVCAGEEPHTLVCLDAVSGAVRWRAPHPVVDALPEAQREDVRALVAAAEAAEPELDAVRRRYGLAQRRLRASGGVEGAAELEGLASEMNRLKQAIDAAAPYRTPPSQGMVGWSSPTPVAGDDAVYVLYGQGVVAAHEADGRRRWVRWLGPPQGGMVGYEDGISASPVIAGGRLVVPYNRLLGLDPATGETVWDGGEWRQYGGPAVARVGGREVLVTPYGRVHDAASGRVLAEDLAEMWYVSPVVVDDLVLLLEARAGLDVQQAGGMLLKAVRLTGDPLRVEPAWTTKLPIHDPVYTAPVAAHGYAHVVTKAGHVVTVSLASGEVTSGVDVEALRPHAVFSSPSVAGDRLWITTAAGDTAVLTTGARPALETVLPLSPLRTSLVFEDDVVFVRTRDDLRAIGE